MSRWIRVQTSIFDHEVFASEPFSEREAWVWLIAKAAWKDTKHRIGHRVVDVPSGSVFLTLREMQAVWRWKSDKRVRSFLLMLEREGMIETKSDAGKTQVTICNYSRYQEAGRTEDAAGTHGGRTADALKTPVHQNTISEAKASSSTPRGELETVLDAERAGAVLDHRKRIGKPLTAYAAKQLAAKMGLCPDPNFAADEMVSNGWQGFKPEWLETRTQRATSPPNRKPNAFDAYDEIAQMKGWNDEPASLPSANQDAERLPAVSGGPSGPLVDLRRGHDWHPGSGDN